MNMIERVARAIMKLEQQDQYVPDYEDIARIAIEAMREPDPDVIKEISKIAGPQAAAYWLAGHHTMISAALAE